MTGHIDSINCTNCGAGLPVLGGGRVTTQVCGYCGATLDANDAYAVLSRHVGMQRPASPFSLGMTGQIDGAAFTVIGTLGYVERWDGSEWRWVDHMLYSPTHGYAWLTLEDGHTLLTRKVRDWPGGAFLTATSIELMESRPVRHWQGETFTYYATSNWEIDFVEGEFTWRPEKGQRGSSVSLMPKGAASRMLTYAQGADGGGEREIEQTRYFPEAAAAFGAEAPVPQGIHPLQPYAAKPGKRFYRMWFGAMTAASLVIAIMVSASAGRPVEIFYGSARDLPLAEPFEVTRLDRPVRVQLFQALSQSWAEYDITLTDPAGQLLAETGRGISYYYGGSGEDAWTEGSRYASLTFQPTVAGKYLLEMEAAELDSGVGRTVLQVTVQEGRGRALYAWIMTALFGMALLWTLSSRMRHRAARWKGSDWTEEDDD